MKLYCVHPISGLSYEQVYQYYQYIVGKMQTFGYDVLHPMTAKSYLQNVEKFHTVGYDNPASTNHAIVARDRWMVMQADVIYANLMSATTVSIGSCMELAWAHDHGKHTVVAMGKDNPHKHAFVLEAADIIYESPEGAEEYLKKLVRGEV